jgi:hypothetical protein
LILLTSCRSHRATALGSDRGEDTALPGGAAGGSLVAEYAASASPLPPPAVLPPAVSTTAGGSTSARHQGSGAPPSPGAAASDQATEHDTCDQLHSTLQAPPSTGSRGGVSFEAAGTERGNHAPVTAGGGEAGDAAAEHTTAGMVPALGITAAGGVEAAGALTPAPVPGGASQLALGQGDSPTQQQPAHQTPPVSLCCEAPGDGTYTSNQSPPLLAAPGLLSLPLHVLALVINALPIHDRKSLAGANRTLRAAVSEEATHLTMQPAA